MSLILAIEPDRRQASQLKHLVRSCAGAALVLADTTELALEAIGNRIPDLVLIPALLSPQDDASLATALRVIAAAAHVQILTIPVFAGPSAPIESSGGVLAKWWSGRERSAAPEGCDPAVFAEQIAAYLAESAAARRSDAEYEERESPISLALTERTAGASPVVADADAWSDAAADQWNDPPTAEVAYAAANEPVAAESEPAPMSFESEPEQPIEFAPEPFADPAATWPPVVFSAEHEPLDTDANAAADADAGTFLDSDELDLRAFLAGLEEQRHEPHVDVGVEPETVEPLEAAPIVQAPAQMAMPALTKKPEPVRAPIAPSESSAPLTLTPHRWPRLEGVLAEVPRNAPARIAPALNETIAEQDAVVPKAAARQAPEPVREVRVRSRPESGRPEWLDMLDALRRDLDRLRVERTDPAAPAPLRLVPPTSRQQTAPAVVIDDVQAAEPAASVNVAPAASVNVAPAVPRKKKVKQSAVPVQDEWGFFDPTQCGFTALLAKLDEISNSNDDPPKPSE